MNKASYLASIRQNYRPGLVCVSDEAIAKLPLKVAQVTAMPQELPFAHPAPGEDFTDRDALRTLAFLLSLAGLQYRFWWQEPPGDEVQRYVRGSLLGSVALTVTHGALWHLDGTPSADVLNAARSVESVANVYGDTLPDLQSRSAVLHEVLVSPAGDQAARTLLQTLREGAPLDIGAAARLAEQLPLSFGDPYLKKAMLCLTMVANCWLGQRLKARVDLCAFADYQVPNVLRHFGVLQYAPHVAQGVDTLRPIVRAGEVENAIRSATVLACEAIAEYFKVSAHEVDWWLFTRRKEPVTPFHLCVTTDY